MELANGDNVGVVTRWQPPGQSVGPTEEEIAAVVEAAEGGAPYHSRNKAWVGRKVAAKLGLVLENAHDRKVIEGMIEAAIAETRITRYSQRLRNGQYMDFVEPAKQPCRIDR